MQFIPKTFDHKRVIIAAALLTALAGAAIAQQNKETVKVPEGLALSEFAGYEKWQMVSVSHNGDLLDVVLGNPAMIEAFQAGIPANGKKFPDGAKMVKIHWNTKKSPDGFPATMPDTLHDLDLMAKDSKRFAATGGWGYGPLNYDAASENLVPMGKGTGCGFSCHTKAADRDYVFTEYPKR